MPASPNRCPICKRADCQEIDDALALSLAPGFRPPLNYQPINPQLPFDPYEYVAYLFNNEFTPFELRRHHNPDPQPSTPTLNPQPRPSTLNSDNDSLQARIKVREANALALTIQEYSSTLTLVGRKIRKMAQFPGDSVGEALSKLLTKPVVDLYIGLGAEIRETVQEMSVLNRDLNGPDENSNAGLIALAGALTVSVNPPLDPQLNDPDIVEVDP